MPSDKQYEVFKQSVIRLELGYRDFLNNLHCNDGSSAVVVLRINSCNKHALLNLLDLAKEYSSLFPDLRSIYIFKSLDQPIKLAKSNYQNIQTGIYGQRLRSHVLLISYPYGDLLAPYLGTIILTILYFRHLLDKN